MVSLRPLLLSLLAMPLLSTAYLSDLLDRPISSRLYNQDFGMAMRPDLSLEELLYPYDKLLRNRDLLSLYYRPAEELLRLAAISNDRGISGMRIADGKMQVTLDVRQFKPEEVEVKVVGKYIVVKGNHEEKLDESGLVSRQFVRRYAIPDTVDVEQIKSTISSDGVLMIQAPLKEQPERKIEIEQTGEPARKPKDEGKKEAESTTTSSTTEEVTVEVAPEN